MVQQPTAAEALYGHLPRAERPERTRPQSSLADALYPRPKPKPSDPYRESLLRHLKEANAAIDARLAKERGR